MSRFKKPTVEEVRAYMVECDFFNIDQPGTFHDYFESKGWHVGKSKMKDWKAAVRNWIRNARTWDSRYARNKSSNQTFADRQREQAATALAELEAMEQRDREVSLRVVR